MANKQDKFYFDNLVSAADSSCKAAEFLVKCLNDYDHADIGRMLTKMHMYEHDGDTKKHEMSAALAKAFVTPVDREDLALISNNIDDVTDSIEDVLQRFYMNSISVVLPDAITFAQKILVACNYMKEMLGEFENFNKPAKLHELIIKLNDVEEECDELYLQAKFKIMDNCSEVLDILSWREIFDRMERCADACEHVGDCVDTVVMKNS